MNNILQQLRTHKVDKPLLYVGVNNALGARIAEEAGADGLWISSFEVSAANGLPDADILTMDD